MTLTIELWSALVRGVCIGALALVIARPVRLLLTSEPKKILRLAWLLLLLPFLTPVLLVGYAYSNFSLSLLRYPLCNELLYNLLVLIKLAPVAALVLCLYPPSVSSEGLHCHRLLKSRAHALVTLISGIKFRLRASLRPGCVAFSLVFLFAFCEFEMASLLGIGSWTVKLFDAQAGGLVLTESVWLALAPAAFEAALLATVLILLYRARGFHAPPLRRTAAVKAMRYAVWTYLFAGVVVICVIPAVVVLRGTFDGLGILAENFVLAGDVAASVLFAIGAAGAAYMTAGWLARRVTSGAATKAGLLGVFLFCSPGLLGALLLSLLALSFFQLPGLHMTYNTPLPLLLVLALLVLPYAVLLRTLLHSLRPGQALHLAGLLGKSSEPSSRRHAKRINWELSRSMLLWVAFLLFCWAYYDMTASSLLSPPGMTPVFVRLYNLMHYGQSSVLSAMVCVSILVPVLLLAGAWAARSIFTRIYLHE